MSFINKTWRAKKEIERDNLEADIAATKKRLSDQAASIMHRTFIRNASLQQMQAAKQEHRKLTAELLKLNRKLEKETVR